MNLISIIILIVIAIWVVVVIRYFLKNKKISGCMGDCSNCVSQCKPKK